MIKIIGTHDELAQFDLEKYYVVYSHKHADVSGSNIVIDAVATTEEEGQDAHDMLDDLYGTDTVFILFPPKNLCN